MTSDHGKPRLLFVCTQNAGRSVLGAALARKRGGDTVEVDSAGVRPAATANPVTVASLAEIGIDDSAHVPSAITPERVAAADVVIAMKPGLDIPQVEGVRYETWTLPDPDGWDVDSIRSVRDDIDRQVQELLAELGR